MPQKSAKVIPIKKLKKDGSLDRKLLQVIISYLETGKGVILPVDSIYTAVTTTVKKITGPMAEVCGDNNETVWLISNFKMLDELALIDKLAFDFLHRIWPGEITVLLQSREKDGNKIYVRMPKSKYMLDIIEALGSPLVSLPVCDEKKKVLYKKNVIQKNYAGIFDLLVFIDEFLKEHSPPSVVDITEGTLDILEEGRVSDEEIKSLYFLGQDDPVE